MAIGRSLAVSSCHDDPLTVPLRNGMVWLKGTGRPFRRWDPSVVGTPGGLMDSTAAPLHSAASGAGASYGRATVSPGLTIRTARAGGHFARLATWHRLRHRAGSRLASARLPEVTALNDSRIQVHACDDVTAFSFRHETPVPACPGCFLDLSRAVALQDLVIALVALLVALVHHRRSYSVTLGNRTGMVQSRRQMRGSLRWSVTQRDWIRRTDHPRSGLKIWGPGPG
jgi:hypothetical protein